MALLFRRQDPEDEPEDLDEAEAAAQGELLSELPQYAVIVSDVATDGWHVAAVIGESTNPDYYVRALTVRWPFVIARPVRSNRTSDKPVGPDLLSPTGTTPARRLVVNWRWLTVEDSVSQLRFYVRRKRGPFLPAGCVRVRLTLKELAWPGRRFVVKTRSNRIIWNPPEFEMLESPPDQST